jgi:hypothetical protein
MHVSDDDRIDLRALDPERDATRLDRTANAVAARVMTSLRARRARQSDPWALLADWRRPVLAAAAAIVVISTVTIVRTPRSAGVAATTTTSSAATADTATTLFEAAGLPGAVASWVEADAPPRPSKTLDLQGMP